MIRTAALVAAFSLALSGAVMAAGYTLDAKGKCHDDKGKFAKQEMCVQHTYKKDSAGKCRDEKGKFASAKNCS